MVIVCDLHLLKWAQDVLGPFSAVDSFEIFYCLIGLDISSPRCGALLAAEIF